MNMVWKTIGGKRVNIRRGRKRQLYTNPQDRSIERREFTERYGKKKGRYVYGAVVGKTRREQFEAGTRGRYETVKRHASRSRTGKRETVRRHRARVE